MRQSLFLRLAVENKLLISDIDCWFNYIAVRNNTSYDYNGTKAQEALELMGDFIGDAIDLYEKISCES